MDAAKNYGSRSNSIPKLLFDNVAANIDSPSSCSGEVVGCGALQPFPIFLGAKAFYEAIDGFCQGICRPLLDQI
jgi:hypothetical protein